MKIQLKETVLEYRAEDLAAWKRGDKSKLLEGEEVLPEIYTQPNYSFGEYFVLNYFKKARWKGFCFYALGDWEVDNPKYERGRKKIKELFPEKQLSEFKKVRERHKLAKGAGEPDLFLYMEGGPTLFLEVKKEKDRIRSVQLTTFAIVNAVDCQRFSKEYEGRDCFAVYYAKYHELYAKMREKEKPDSELALINQAYLVFHKQNQAKIGHAFRHLYNTVKFVKNSQIENKKFYTNLIRAQLSGYELLILFYSCLSDIGREKFKPLIEDFALLKGIPLDSLIDPKTHPAFYKQAAYGLDHLGH